MNKSLIYIVTAFTLFFYACNGNSDEGESEYVFTPPKIDSIDPTIPYFPFQDYINNQINYVDSTPFGIIRTIEINGKQADSGFISKDAFKLLANSFLEFDPNNPTLKPNYAENSFNDLTTNRITFSISTKNNNLPLQQADILLNAETQKVKNVLLRKQLISPDSSVLQHLVWVDNMHFQISESITLKNKPSYTRVTRVVWDKPME